MPEPRDVDRADVYKAGVLAGDLRRDGDLVSFRYDPAYLDDSSRRPVGWALPKTDQPVTATAGSVPPFFAGLLPEGARLQAVVQATRTSIDDHFTLLVAVGADAIGDVQVVPHGEPLAEPTPALDEDAIATSNLNEVFARATGVDALRFDPAALPGVQPKVSAAMRSTPLQTSRRSAILKLNPATDYPRLVQNEHFFLRMATACDLRVPKHRLVHDADGRAGLLVERFDRTVTADGVHLRGQEDACQVLNVYPASKYRIKTETAIRELGAVCERSGGASRVATLDLLRLVAFSYLVGNGDLHGKNMSVGDEGDGRWRVTPAYDLVSTQPYLGWRDPMALDLYGRANRFTRAHLVEAGDRLGVPGRATVRMLDEIVRAATRWVDRLDEIGLPARTTSRLIELIRARLDELGREAQ
jgi:serine/threonine-protein kinase HipA